jgi:hypothetical protein
MVGNHGNQLMDNNNVPTHFGLMSNWNNMEVDKDVNKIVAKVCA